MHPRIMGLETEWAITAKVNGSPCTDFFGFEKDRDKFYSYVPFDLGFPNQNDFLANGARLYLDYGNHLEYATPEALGPHEVLLYGKAGEKIVETMIHTANQKWPKVHLRSFKNNLDISGISYGSHENYLIIRSESTKVENLIRTLGPFLISRIIFCGNGWLGYDYDSHESYYYLSQRALVTKVPISEETRQNRGLINTPKDEKTYADKGKYYRLHLIAGDALMTEVAQFLRFGATDMVLDMIENDFLTSPPEGLEVNGKRLLDAFYNFNHDITLKRPYTFDKKSYTAVDLQEWYFTRASEFYASRLDTDPEREEVLRWWRKMINLARQPLAYHHLAFYVDWAAKRFLMERELIKLGKSSNLAVNLSFWSPKIYNKLKMIDFLFHENHPSGLARKLEERESLTRIVSEKEVESCILRPLSTTRAWARASQIEWARKFARDQGVAIGIEPDWSGLNLYYNAVFYSFNHLDPFDTDPKIKEQELMESFLRVVGRA